MKTTLMIVLCSAAILASGCATSHSRATAWEYKVMPGGRGQIAPFEQMLNRASVEGWEVVTVWPDQSGEPLALLRRPK